MKWLAFSVVVGALGAALHGVAWAGCPQAGDGCDAVVKISAALEGAPMCVRVDRAGPENGCVCQGTVYVVNDCAVDLVATDFTWGGADTTVPPGKTGQFDRSEEPVGEHHEELHLTSDGKAFTLILDYTVEHRAFEPVGCGVSGRGELGVVGAGLGLAALAFARRRARR